MAGLFDYEFQLEIITITTHFLNEFDKLLLANTRDYNYRVR